MPNHTHIAGSKDKVLFTPGPLTTSLSVKQAMLRDLGSRDFEFIAAVKDIRARLAAMTGAPNDFEAVLMQGSGTFSVEAVKKPWNFYRRAYRSRSSPG